MNLPLSNHAYGEHELVLPPDDPTSHDDADIPLETRLRMYRMLQEMRQFEKRAYDMFMQQLVKGTTHLSLGMEAVAAGFGAAMRTRRLHLRHLPRPRPHARAGRADGRRARRAARSSQRPARRQGRIHAPDQRGARRDGVVRDHRGPPDHRQRRRLVRAVPRERAGRRVLLRRRHHQHRRVPRGAQLRGGLQAADRVRLREQPVHGVHRDRRHHRRTTPCRGPRVGVRPRAPSSSTATTPTPSTSWPRTPSSTPGPAQGRCWWRR